MSIYDQRTRVGNPRNPAKALYSFWHGILKQMWTTDSNGRPIGSYQFGYDRNYGIGPYCVYGHTSDPVGEVGTNEYPHLCFGHAGYGAVGHCFTLTRNGEFRLGGFYGHESRNRVARNTFLDWDWHRSGYQWFVNPSHELMPKRFSRESSLLTSWRNPVHYVHERLIVPQYRFLPYWLKLERDTNVVGGWKIAFSRPSDLPAHTYHLDVDHAERLKRYEALRLKRLRLARDAELLASGELVREHSKARSRAEIEDRKTLQALALAAHLNVSMPAKTTPLKRTSEEEVTNGNDHLRPHDADGAATLAPGKR